MNSGNKQDAELQIERQELNQYCLLYYTYQGVFLFNYIIYILNQIFV